jgi:tRNA-splicing ligase RtcB
MNIKELDDLGKPYKIFAEVIEQGALDQFADFMRIPWVVQGALMPDSHTGYSLPIGAVIACKDTVSPQAVGYDIGCGMCALQTGFDADEIRGNAKTIFDQIYRSVPVGFNHNKVDSEWRGWMSVTETTQKIFDKNGLKQLGTLGGGNHFIELGYDELDYVWIIVHSGSRGIGHAVATHYMKLAAGGDKAREGVFGLSTDSQEGKDYITDLNFCLEFALENRKQIINRVVAAIERMGMKQIRETKHELINRNHNHAELKDGLWIHRKGATHAEEGMMGVIPGNMRDGSFIVCGKGNPDSLCSSSHGAGRVMGRKEAQKVLDMDKFTESMQGITAQVTERTLDESAFAYKDVFEVMRLQKDLIDVVAYVKPIINIKG